MNKLKAFGARIEQSANVVEGSAAGACKCARPGMRG